MFLGREAAHVRPNLSDDGLGGHRADAGDGLEQRHGLFHGREQVFNLLLQLGDRLFQEVKVDEDALEQPPVVGLYAPLHVL